MRRRWYILGSAAGAALVLLGALMIPSWAWPLAIKGDRGKILGWEGRLYKLTSVVPAHERGARLGASVYHGSVSGGFTVFSFRGRPTDAAIIFQANIKNQSYDIAAVVTRSP